MKKYLQSSLLENDCYHVVSLKELSLDNFLQFLSRYTGPNTGFEFGWHCECIKLLEHHKHQKNIADR